MEDTKPCNTLFLDRDGVINKQRTGDYVKTWDEFLFLDGVLEALPLLSALFKYIIIVTNQRGVGKGLMTLQALEDIHSRMLHEITAHNGRIDKLYYCTALEENDSNRKPNTGMALQAQKDFPGIEFGKSLLAGDSVSDMKFAGNAGIPAILIGNKYGTEEISKLSISAHYPDLLTFAKDIERK
jgi:D-glycero-D-manno-heptose 1,7-bisphosphate phosphatase/D-glycero-alpha-D-manno-heptose 1-phosphate guanylyltransferase